MHKTRNNLSKDTRRNVIAAMQSRLADAIVLGQACRQAHWAVRGPGFAALHELFDELSGESAGHADDLAERIAALGGQPEGTAHAAVKGTGLKPFPTDRSEQGAVLAALADRFAAFGAAVRSDIDRADAAGDAGTADLFTQIGRAADKALWKLEAHAASKG